MDKNLNTLLKEIKEDLTTYLNLRLKLFQLEVIEKAGITVSVLFFGLVLMLVFFFVILFIFLAFGLYLGELLHSYAAGIGIIAAFYLAILLFLFFKRKGIQSWLVNIFLKELLKNDKENEQKSE